MRLIVSSFEEDLSTLLCKELLVKVFLDTIPAAYYGKVGREGIEPSMPKQAVYSRHGLLDASGPFVGEGGLMPLHP